MKTMHEATGQLKIQYRKPAQRHIHARGKAFFVDKLIPLKIEIQCPVR